MAESELKERILAWCAGAEDCEVVQDRDDPVAEVSLVLRIGRPDPVRVGVFKSPSSDKVLVLHTLKLPRGPLSATAPAGQSLWGDGPSQAEFTDSLARVIEARAATVNATARDVADGHEVTVNSWIYVDGLSKHTLMSAVEEVVRTRRVIDRLQRELRPETAPARQLDVAPGDAVLGAPQWETAPAPVVPVAQPTPRTFATPEAGSAGSLFSPALDPGQAASGSPPGGEVQTVFPSPSPAEATASESPFAPHPSSLTPEESAFAPQESAPTGDAGTASGQAPGGWAPPQHPSEPQPLWQTPEPQGQAHAEPVPQWQPPEVQEPLSLERESQTQAPYPQPEAQTQPEAHIEPEQAQAAGWATPQPTTAGWMPTHVVPTTGMDAWAVPDPTQPTIARLDPGVPVQVVETKGAWAHIVCSNTWSGWVDYRILVQLPR